MECLKRLIHQDNNPSMGCNIDQKTKLANKPFSKEINAIFNHEHPRDLQKEPKIGHEILVLGKDLKHMRVTWKVLFKLDELNALLSEVNQLEGKKVIWALRPAMLALIQPKFLEEPCERVRLPVASCLNNIMRLTAPIPPFNDDVMRRVFKLIVQTFQDLDNSAASTFGKKLEVLEIMAMVRTYEIMFDLGYDVLIHQMF